MADMEAGLPSSLKPTSDSSKSCLCKCICWSLILLLIIIVTTVGISFLIIKPKLPNYTIDNLIISYMRLYGDSGLDAGFNVEITIDNLNNEKLGIYYEKGSQISVWYKNANIGNGTLPEFYQAPQTKTTLGLSLTGLSRYGKNLIVALKEAERLGRIPLQVKINAPVRMKLGALELPTARVLGDCMIMVNSLSPDDTISITYSTTCKFRLEL